jgi:hypothetical protein
MDQGSSALNEKGTAMRSIGYLVGAAIAASAALNHAGTAAAGPLPVNATALKTAAADDVIDVRYRGGGAFVAGLAFGLIGGAIASRSYYYPAYYYYPYAPAYYYPPYPYYGSYWGYRPYVYYRPYPRYRYFYPRYRYYGVW